MRSPSLSSMTSEHARQPFTAVWFLALGVALIFGSNALAADPPRAEPVAPPAGSSNPVAFTNSMEVLDDSRPLTIGDRLSLRIVEDRKPPIETVIRDSGEMEV